jgi:hypothetical protein
MNALQKEPMPNKIADAVDKIANLAEAVAVGSPPDVHDAFDAFGSQLHALADEIRAAASNGPGPTPTLPDKL